MLICSSGLFTPEIEHGLANLEFAQFYEHLIFEVHADLLLIDNVQLLVHASSKTFTLVHLTGTF